MSSYMKTALQFRRKVDAILQNMPSFVKDYVRAIRTRSSARTIYEYLLDLQDFFRWMETQNLSPTLDTLSRLEKEDFEDYIETKEQRVDKNGVIHSQSRRSLSRRLSALRQFFNYLFRAGLSRNEIQKVALPKIHKKAIIRLDRDETEDLLREVESPSNLTKKQADYHSLQKIRDTAVLLLFLSTGVRVSECVEMDMEDVDLQRNRIKIVRKGGDEAFVYLSDEAQKALSAWLDQRKTIRCSNAENAVFLSSRGTRMSVRSMEYLIKKYAQRAVPGKHITPHKLRATYATALYNATGDIYLVAESLGHKDITTTRDHYAEMTDDRKRTHRNAVSYGVYDNEPGDQPQKKEE